MLTAIGQSEFAVTELSQVTIPSTVEQIGLEAFCDCKNLTEIVISNPKTVIGDSAATISNGLRANGFDESHIAIWEQYYNGVIRGEADSTAAAYAKKYGYTFEALRRRIHFIANGGKGTQAAMQAIAGLEFSLPECRFNAPDGKIFIGWQIGEKTYQPGETVVIEKDTEIKAVWGAEKQKYTVGDVDGDGTVDMKDNGSAKIISDGSYRIMFGDNMAKTDTTDTGLMFTLVFSTQASAPDYLTGDVDENGEVSVEDAQLALLEYVNAMTGLESSLTERQKRAGDVDGDHEVTVEDAQTILLYYVSNVLSGESVTWDELLGKIKPAERDMKKPEMMCMSCLTGTDRMKFPQFSL